MKTLSPEILCAAESLWDYHKLDHKIVPSDCIMALGSHDLRVAERVAELYHAEMSELIVMSGGLGNFTKEMWTEKEANKFATVAINLGVPEEKIIIENQSTNTGENILFTRQLLAELNLDPNSFIIVQKPYMERRAYATFKKTWPKKDIAITSPEISFADYPTLEIPMERVINIMVGDLQRINEYPKKGFQIYQEIPAHVWQAGQFLIEKGFDEHLINIS